MTQLHAINKNGKLFVIKKEYEDENRDQFLKRSWWIAKQVCKHPKKDLEQIENESLIWSNVSIYNVAYDDIVMQTVNAS